MASPKVEIMQVDHVDAIRTDEEIHVEACGRVNTGGWSCFELVPAGKTDAHTLEFRAMGIPPKPDTQVTQATTMVKLELSIPDDRKLLAVKVVASGTSQTSGIVDSSVSLPVEPLPEK